ncbi:uncharacterized protein RJT21DRAFT_141295 [Scheffersomyces amazonensis]|uniref:uncharacterized protein n=1 Tax=Scheffersomyces amazonensis TaxID=1078765 RepID=UPI00315DE13C
MSSTLSIPSSNTSSSSSETTIGLSTPHLNEGENVSLSTVPSSSSGQNLNIDETDGSINVSKITSVFDIAQTMQEKLGNVVQLLDKQDSEINDRIDKLLKQITKLENNITNDK